MKNIHILPTNKPSRLSTLKNKLVLFNTEGEGSMTYHIYITSDEVIKEDDWGLSKLNEVILFGRSYNEKFYKKIILTTDHDLIKDGVQAIDDVFLEWFVKNPSCEKVELGLEHYFDKNIDKSPFFPLRYKIIIPQEEQTKCYCGHTSYCDCGPQEETKQDQVERMYSEEEVRNIANWAFGFYRRNDLSDSELEDEFNRVLTEQFKKK